MKTQNSETTLETDHLVPLPHVAKHLDISVRGLYRLIARNDLPIPVKVGGSSKLFYSDLEDYKACLKSQRTL